MQLTATNIGSPVEGFEPKWLRDPQILPKRLLARPRRDAGARLI
jgi:hypothetical protein